MLENKELFKEELLKSPLIELVKKQLETGDDLVCITISGSYAAGIAVEDSDIDIAINSLKSWNTRNLLAGEYHKVPFHWWVSPIAKDLIHWEQPEHIGLLFVGSYYFPCSLLSENVIWINSKYEPLFSFIQQNNSVISLFAVFSLVKYNKQFLLMAEKSNKFLISKTMIPLIDFYYSKNEMTRNISLLKKIKKYLKDKTVKLEEDEWQEIKIALAWTKDYCNKNRYPIIELLEWHKQVEEIIKECQNN